jgi:hypothetical protein
VSFISLRYFVVGISVAGLAAGIISLISGMNFWLTLGIAIAALLINGYVAAVEDRDAGL